MDDIAVGRLLERVDQLEAWKLTVQTTLSDPGIGWASLQAQRLAAKRSWWKTERVNIFNVLITAPIGITVGFLASQLLTHLL